MIEHAWAQPELPARSANDWKKEWDKTIEGAKREGRVHVYIGGWGAVLDAGEFRYLDLDSRPEWIDMKPIVNVFEEAFGRKQKN